uniref:t-SNARE coiled-coil homology domain-containing protein n=1 Tax=Plectus sambesii TaxID=2011161 RepID=A0A914WP97_9BILA
MVVLNNFQSAQRQAVEKEKASIKRVRAANSAYGADQQPSYDSEPSRGQQRQLQVEQNVDLQAIKERQQALSQLESDITDVNQIFKDLALMVHEQGEIVDSIEANVDHAVVHVEQGASNVQRAATYQAASRRKKVCLLIFFVMAILILILFIWLWTK